MFILSESDDVTEAKTILKNYSTITDLVICHYVLGIKIEYTSTYRFLSLLPFIEKSIQLSEMETAKPAEIPVLLSHCLCNLLKQISESKSWYMKRVQYQNELG